MEHQLQSAALMLPRSTRVAAASLLLSCAACGRASPDSAPPRTPLASDYLTIQPDVSVSRSAQPAEEKHAAIDPNADVMAEILAIPPGH